MDIENIIQQKEAMLGLARAKVAELEQQIASLRIALDAIRGQDEVDHALSRKAQSQQIAASAADGVSQSRNESLPPKPASRQDEVVSQATPAGRNPRGGVKNAILDILEHGQEMDLDDIESALNSRVSNNVSRGSLRTVLMNLKNAGDIVSRKPGCFQLKQKGETPVAPADGSPQGGGFMLQPSPLDGA